jgi:RNA 2',3'-cyclic 3'-phosphodiesterase
VRVFVAIPVPDDVRRALSEFIAKLQRTGSAVRWVRTEGMHVTLKFIGETSEEKVERIKAAIAAVRSAAPVTLRFRNTGFFPNPKHPRVFWAGIDATPNLAEIAHAIESKLEPLDIPRETRAFSPHLTLARFNSQEGVPRLGEALAQLAPFEFGATTVRQFHLYQSVLKRGGAEYTVLADFDFVKGGA